MASIGNFKNYAFASVVSLLLFFTVACTECNSDKADTRANRDGFQSHFHIEPDDRVTGVYFFADEWGGDACYWFVFSAPPEIIETIVKNLNLKRTESRKEYCADTSVADFPWWKNFDISHAEHYFFCDDQKEIAKDLWYNRDTMTCRVALMYW